jgi:MSHA pilin protein MshA
MKTTHTPSAPAGFTLIELVVVIVLLGILGVTALGKFQDLSQKAADAAEQGVASELTSAAAINYAADVVDAGSAISINAVDCVSSGTAPSTTLDALMASGSAPTSNYEYSVVGANEGDACNAGETFRCSVRNTNGDNTVDATATIICTN